MLHIVKSSPACNELKARTKAREAAEQEVLQVRQEREGALAIINAWNAASDWGRAEAFRVIGVADVWDVLADVVG